MEITIDLDEAEVLALRTGGPTPLSLRDKLGDAVHIMDVGWYLVDTDHADEPRPRWWSGRGWLWAPDGERAVVNNPTQAKRLYLADER